MLRESGASSITGRSEERRATTSCGDYWIARLRGR